MSFFGLFGRKPDELSGQLNKINKRLEKIMANQQEAIAALQSANEKLGAAEGRLGKVLTETQSLKAEIQRLNDAASGQTITPELSAAIAAISARSDSLSAAVGAVDDEVPDAGPPS